MPGLIAFNLILSPHASRMACVSLKLAERLDFCKACFEFLILQHWRPSLHSFLFGLLKPTGDQIPPCHPLFSSILHHCRVHTANCSAWQSKPSVVSPIPAPPSDMASSCLTHAVHTAPKLPPLRVPVFLLPSCCSSSPQYMPSYSSYSASFHLSCLLSPLPSPSLPSFFSSYLQVPSHALLVLESPSTLTELI